MAMSTYTGDVTNLKSKSVRFQTIQNTRFFRLQFDFCKRKYVF